MKKTGQRDRRGVEIEKAQAEKEGISLCHLLQGKKERKGRQKRIKEKRRDWKGIRDRALSLIKKRTSKAVIFVK